MVNLKQNYKKIIFYIFCLLLFFVLSRANIGVIVSPFSYAIFFALVFCGVNVLPLSVAYFVANILNGVGISNLVCISSVILFLNLLVLVYKKTNKEYNVIWFSIVMFFSALPLVYFDYVSKSNLLFSFVSIFVGIAFFLCCVNALSSFYNRGLNTKFTLDESICFCVIIAVLSVGLASFSYFQNAILMFIASFFILFFTFSFSSFSSLVCSISIGIGASLYFNNVTYIAIFASFCLTIIAFKGERKIYSVLALFVTHILLTYYFKCFEYSNYLTILPVIISGVLFICVPKKWSSELYNMFGETKQNSVLRNIVNRSREGLTKRMTELSSVFQEMNCVFRNMVKGGLPKDEVKELIIGELKEKVCSSCPDKNRCYRTFSTETKATLSNLTEIGFEKGKVTIIDVPASLTTRCGKVNTLLTKLNNLLDNYKQYSSVIKNMDYSRVLIADQLNGVSKLLLDLAEETKRNVTFDYFKEEKVMQELSANRILANNVIIYEQNENDYNVNVLVSNADIDKDISSPVSKVTGVKMMTVQKQQSEYSGLSLVTLKPAPNYDVSYGVASIAKNNNEFCGDTHSAIRLSANKIMFALCDGMGSGEKAEKFSNLSITLIEDFYKAGFSSDIILSSANKLLALSQEEEFSAIDICVIDLSNATLDLIKVGSSVSVLKHDMQVSNYVASSLPLGILEEIKPTIYNLALKNGNMLVLSSDGVVDSFESVEDYSTFVNNIVNVNPQLVAEEILNRAILNDNKVPNDDMTVLVIKIFEI